jgi:hypothetical protein
MGVLGLVVLLAFNAPPRHSELTVADKQHVRAKLEALDRAAARAADGPEALVDACLGVCRALPSPPSDGADGGAVLRAVPRDARRLRKEVFAARSSASSRRRPLWQTADDPLGQVWWDPGGRSVEQPTIVIRAMPQCTSCRLGFRKGKAS